MHKSINENLKECQFVFQSALKQTLTFKSNKLYKYILNPKESIEIMF